MGLSPSTWAAIAGIAGPVLGSLLQKKGKLEFKQQPESPYERALRIYAEQLAGVPNAAGQVSPGAMPTYNYIAPQAHNMLQNFGAQSAAYQPLQRLDLSTGQPVASTAPKVTLFDFSSISKPWERPVAAMSAYNDPANAPPPPPSVYKSDFNDRLGSLAKGAASGSVAGLIGGPLGAVGGALGGIFGGRKKYKDKEKSTKAAYDQWAELYGAQFVDSTGRPVPVPKNTAEYNAWYISRYGVKPPGVT